MPSLRGCPLCTGGGIGRTKVNYAAIMQAFTDAGMFGPDIRDLARETEDLARKLSPVRSGRMRALHYRVIQPPVGYTRNFYVGTKAGYAPFVLGGTTGPIRAKGNKPMELRPIPYSYFRADSPGRFRMEVRGQKANNWLREALNRAVRTRLRG